MLDSLRAQVRLHEANLAALTAETQKLTEQFERYTTQLTMANRWIRSHQNMPEFAHVRDYEVDFYQDQLAILEGQLADRRRATTREELALSDILHKLALAEQDAKTQKQFEETRFAIEELRNLPERIVVLFVASNPLNQAHLRLDEEARAIKEKIRAAKHRDAVQLETCWAARPLDLLQAMHEHSPRVLHFSGHGTEDDELVFQADDGKAKRVTKAALLQVMQATQGELQLVFLNACYTDAQAREIVQHVPAAIGMRTAIGDEAARVFAAHFYSAIGFAKSVRAAFEAGKAAIMLEGIPEQNTPVLFLAPGVEATELILVRPPEPSSAD